MYPHDYPGNYVEQQYLPEKIKDKKYYVPGENDKLKINPKKLEQKKNLKNNKINRINKKVYFYKMENLL